jgi:hypothetical protein
MLNLDQDIHLQDILFAGVSLSLALLNIVWKMEDSSGND